MNGLPSRNIETPCVLGAMQFGWPYLGWSWDWKEYGLF